MAERMQIANQLLLSIGQYSHATRRGALIAHTVCFRDITMIPLLRAPVIQESTHQQRK
jgi:hypothetical protein